MYLVNLLSRFLGYGVILLSVGAVLWILLYDLIKAYSLTKWNWKVSWDCRPARSWTLIPKTLWKNLKNIWHHPGLSMQFEGSSWNNWNDWCIKGKNASVYAHCGPICYCPQCHKVLRERVLIGEKSQVFYTCKCGTSSHWDFTTAPVPLLKSTASDVRFSSNLSVHDV